MSYFTVYYFPPLFRHSDSLFQLFSWKKEYNTDMPVEVYRIFPWPSFVPAVGLKRPICSGSKIKKCEWVTSLCNDSVLQTLDIFTLSIVTMQLKGERTRDRMQQINTPTHPRKIGTRNPAQLLEPDQKCLYPMLNANNLRTVLHSSGRKKKKSFHIFNSSSPLKKVEAWNPLC